MSRVSDGAGKSQTPTASVTGRQYAQVPKLGGLGGLGYSRLPTTPAGQSAPGRYAAVPMVGRLGYGGGIPPQHTKPAECSATGVQYAKVSKIGLGLGLGYSKPAIPKPATQAAAASAKPVSKAAAPKAPAPTPRFSVVPKPHVPKPPTQPKVVSASEGASHDHSYGQAVVKKEEPDPYFNAAVSTAMFLNVPVREPTPEPVSVPCPLPASTSLQIKKEEEEDDGEYGDVSDIDIQVRNVVCNYTLPLHIDLRQLAQASNNVTFDRGKGVLLKQKRNPMCYVKIYSSGKVYIVGCRSEAECMTAARSIARNVQRAMNKLESVVRIRNYRVCNVLATCKMPFGVKIEDLAAQYPAESQYEPELSVGLVWRNKTPKATLRIHTTGSITVTGAQSEKDVMIAIEQIYPIVRKFRCPLRHREGPAERRKRLQQAAAERKRNAMAMMGGSIGGRYGGPPAKYGRMESGAVGNRIHFSDEDEDDYGDQDLLSDEDY